MSTMVICTLPVLFMNSLCTAQNITIRNHVLYYLLVETHESNFYVFFRAFYTLMNNNVTPTMATLLIHHI
jgi:hypothetical protein